MSTNYVQSFRHHLRIRLMLGVLFEIKIINVSCRVLVCSFLVFWHQIAIQSFAFFKSMCFYFILFHVFHYAVLQMRLSTAILIKHIFCDLQLHQN